MNRQNHQQFKQKGVWRRSHKLLDVGNVGVGQGSSPISYSFSTYLGACTCTDKEEYGGPSVSCWRPPTCATGSPLCHFLNVMMLCI